MCTMWKRKNPEANRAHSQRWFRSISGKIAGAYSGMKQRVEGRGRKETRHIYFGLPLLPRDEFVAWSKESEAFLALHANWLASGYQIRLAPSVDRIDSSRGYTLDNLRWVTQRENSRGGAITKWSKFYAATA